MIKTENKKIIDIVNIFFNNKIRLNINNLKSIDRVIIIINIYFL